MENPFQSPAAPPAFLNTRIVAPDLKTREYGLDEAFNLAWQLFRAQLGLFLFLGLVTAVPTSLLSIVGSQTFTTAGQLTAIGTAFIGLLGTLSVLHATGELLEGRDVTFFEALSVGLRCWAPAMVVLVLFGGCCILAGLLLVVPGVIVYVYLQFFVCAIVLGGDRGAAALSRSWRAVRMRWFRCCAFGAICVGLAAIPTMLGYAALSRAVPDPVLREALQSVLNSTWSLLLVPLDIAAGVLFINLDAVPSSPDSPLEHRAGSD